MTLNLGAQSNIYVDTSLTIAIKTKEDLADSTKKYYCKEKNKCVNNLIKLRKKRGRLQ